MALGKQHFVLAPEEDFERYQTHFSWPELECLLLSGKERSTKQPDNDSGNGFEIRPFIINPNKIVCLYNAVGLKYFQFPSFCLL